RGHGHHRPRDAAGPGRGPVRDLDGARGARRGDAFRRAHGRRGAGVVSGPERGTGSATAGDRYSRQELFDGIGAAGQERIRAASVVVAGVGALGSALAETMARAGVGSLTVVDRDYVEESNLQRQSLFDEDDAAQGLPKAVAAEKRLRRLNSEVGVRGLVADVSAENVAALVQGSSLVLDGTDNFETRFLLNDACLEARVPWI